MSEAEGIDVGIDFGTCYIKVAGWNKKKNRPKRLSLDKNQEDSDCRLANAVLYQKNENGTVELVIGDENNCRMDPNNSIRNIKYYLQQEGWEKYIPNLNKKVNAETVLKELFVYIKNTLEEQSSGKAISNVAITMPVCFSELQKQKIINVAQKVELPVKEVILEPVAALFSFLDEFDEGEKNAIVFDFGGATLDLSIANIKKANDKTNVEILASSGVLYGGIDVNNDIYKNIFYDNNVELKNFIDNHKASEEIKMDFLDAVEKIKRMIAKDKVAQREWKPYSADKFKLDMELSNSEFVSMIKELRRNKKIIEAIDEIMEIASIGKDRLDYLIMVGGSARIKYFRDMVSNYLDIEPMDIDEDDMYAAVADGAITYLHLKDESSFSLSNKISYSVGVADENNCMDIKIRKGTRYGYSGRRTKPNIIDEKIPVYQTFVECGKSSIENNKLIIYMGYFDLSDYINILENPYVTYNIDNEGKLYLDLYDGKYMVESIKLLME